MSPTFDQAVAALGPGRGRYAALLLLDRTGAGDDRVLFAATEREGSIFSLDPDYSRLWRDELAEPHPSGNGNRYGVRCEWLEPERAKSSADDHSERIRPFSNGTQGMDWLEGWCGRCAKGNRGGDSYACPIEEAIGLAFVTDGTVSPEIARRMGAEPTGWREYECTEFEEEENGAPGDGLGEVPMVPDDTEHPPEHGHSEREPAGLRTAPGELAEDHRGAGLDLDEVGIPPLPDMHTDRGDRGPKLWTVAFISAHTGWATLAHGWGKETPRLMTTAIAANVAFWTSADAALDWLRAVGVDPDGPVPIGMPDWIRAEVRSLHPADLEPAPDWLRGVEFESPAPAAAEPSPRPFVPRPPRFLASAEARVRYCPGGAEGEPRWGTEAQVAAWETRDRRFAEVVNPYLAEPLWPCHRGECHPHWCPKHARSTVGYPAAPAVAPESPRALVAAGPVRQAALFGEEEG